MKKILVLLVVFALLMPVIAVQGQQTGQTNDTTGGNGQGDTTGSASDEGQRGTGDGSGIDTDDSDESDNLIIAPNQVQTRAKNTNELREMIQTRQQEMEQEGTQGGVQNQNHVRLSVHAFLAMEDLIGGIGPQVSEIARGFNNSVQKTIRAEERMQTRNIFMYFFFGGDEVAAAEIEEELNINQNRIQQLQQLREQCECTEELKNMFQEQIQNVEQEQTRLRELAQEHNMNKGLLGWLWK